MEMIQRLITLLALTLTACGGGEKQDFDPWDQPEREPGNPLTPPDDVPVTPTKPKPPPSAPPSPPGTVTSLAVVPVTLNPPVGLTWHVGLAENVSKSELQSLYSGLIGVSSSLWQITEGQVYLYKVVLFDAVAVGTTPSQWEANNSLFSTSNLDVVIWPASSWDLTGIAGVVWSTTGNQFGRSGRLMLVPGDASAHTLLHEASHLIWGLSWTNSFSLGDEYKDGVQDAACVMESSASPTRWCSSGNHVNQSSQPHSCWTQILNDYGKLSYTGTDSTTKTGWVPLVTYNDAP